MGVIKRQGITNMISGYAGILIGFVNLIVIQPNFLTKEELGLTRILYSFSILVAMFVPLGIGNATLKYFPIFRDEKRGHHGYFGFMNIFPLIGFVVSCFLIYTFRDFILNQYRKESPLFLDYFNYVFPLIFLNAFISVLSVYCNANLKSTVPSFLNDVGVRLMTIVVVSVYFIKWITLDQFITAFVLIYAVQLIVLIGYIYYFETPVFRIDWKIFQEKKFINLIRYGLLLWFAGIASLGLKYFDAVMIGKYMPLAFLGIYTIAAFIPTVIEAPLVAFEKIASAKIAYAWSSDDREQIASIYHQSSLYLFLMGSWLFLIINLNVEALFTFLPEGYAAGRWVVLIISIGTLFNMATGLNAPILFNSDKYRYGAFFLILLAGLVLALQMILIPLFGLEGAAIATSSASIIYNSMLLVSVWLFYKLQPFDTRNLKVLFVLVICFTIGWNMPFIENPYLSIVVNSVTTTFLFAAGIYMLKIVPELEHYAIRFLPFLRRNR